MAMKRGMVPEAEDPLDDLVGCADANPFAADPPPEGGQPPSCAFRAVAHQSVGKHHRVHRPGAGARDRLEIEPLVLEQFVKHAPGEGAVGAAALQREVDRPMLES